MSDLVERVRQVLPSVREDLEGLVRIQSVWADPARRDQVHRSAQATADLLSQAGFGDVRERWNQLFGSLPILPIFRHIRKC